MIVLNVLDNKKYSIFVQKNDIKKIMELNLFAPSALFMPFILGTETITEENKYDFLEYKDNEIILFLSNQNWLLNYNDYCNFSISELVILKCQIIEKMEEIKSKLKRPKKTINQKRSIMLENERYKHFLYSVLYLEKYKTGQISSEFLSNLEKKSSK